MSKSYREQILLQIKKNRGQPIPFKKLIRQCKVPKNNTKLFADLVEKMKANGIIFEDKTGFTLASQVGGKKAIITRLNKTFGFAKLVDEDMEFFIPGKFMKGAMPGDTVIIRQIKGRGERPEAEVMTISSVNFTNFTGTIALNYGYFVLIPDRMPQYELEITNPLDFDLKEGDKVIAEIDSRGKRHSDHTCFIVSNLGDSTQASVCAKAIVELSGASVIFPDEVLAEAAEVSDYSAIQNEAKNRLDLRHLDIFTIDGAATKDIDDAVHLIYENGVYHLGVHIADVSFYVKGKSNLDNEALERGTSIYYANKVVPMLPKELSNGICSLNEKEDRLAFSALMTISEDGDLLDFEFKKTVINSRVKGVYSELNSILKGDKDEILANKYCKVLDQIFLMEKLALVLDKKKTSRGAPQLETVESKLVLDENDYCIDVMPYARGFSEEIIENFMLLANESAAKFAMKHELPFVYRVHENPSPTKIAETSEILRKLGVNFVKSDKVSPTQLAEILNKTKGTDIALVVNNLVLRSMAKAKYSPEPLGHFGLVLADYAHFTSPIRRYPDLAIHRILTDFVTGTSTKKISSIYNKFVYNASQKSSEAELTAMRIERECMDCYKAEFMKQHIGEEFEGKIISVTPNGFFVTLQNSCDGFVPISELTDGEYQLEEAISIKRTTGGKAFRIGDKVKIRVAKVNVNSGKIDFSLC